jgi:ATP-dependent Clp protease ATP-binding subunit ClpA
MGARPMARVIQEHIKRPLAEELLFGSLADGGHVRISVGEDGELELNAEPVQKELAHLPKN